MSAIEGARESLVELVTPGSEADNAPVQHEITPDFITINYKQFNLNLKQHNRAELLQLSKIAQQE